MLIRSRQSKYLWNPKSQRYTDRTGRVVDPLRVRAEVDDLIDTQARRMGALCQQLQADRITNGQWQNGMAGAMRELHVAFGTAARGGWASVSKADYGRIGQRLRVQYKYLRGFAQDIESGKQPLNGAFLNRASMYAQAARGTHEDLRRRGEQEAGQTEEQRLLSAMESCDECVELAGFWAPIGSLPMIGQQICLSNCKCSFVYR